MKFISRCQQEKILLTERNIPLKRDGRKQSFYLSFTFLIFLQLAFAGQVFSQTPSNCGKTQCTSNDVQIQSAYLSDAAGIALSPDNFVCPQTGTAAVYLTLELTTNTPRIGVSIFTNIRGLGADGKPTGNPIASLGQCFGTNLNQPTNKVTFLNPFYWTCGTAIALTDVFIAWGTGNSNFCTGTSFQCPATGSKCFQLPGSQYIPIVTPTPQNADVEVCANDNTGTKYTFNLGNYVTKVSTSPNIVTGWYSDALLMSPIATPASFLTGTTDVYAKVCAPSKSDPTQPNLSACVASKLSIAVNPTPILVITNPAGVCAGSTVNLTAMAVTTGSTLPASTVLSYWTDQTATTSLGSPNAVSVSGTYWIKALTGKGCSDIKSVVVTINPNPTANAGSPFTKTCTQNASGGTIGEAAQAGFSYSWSSSPVGFTSSAANPSVNPSLTTTYTVVKTNTTTGCSDSKSVIVTVDNAPVTANAGSPFTKTCTQNANGGTIGEAAQAGFSYSWSSSPAGFTSSAANPSVNPSLTTTYTVVKTNTTTGCNDSKSVTVTVNNAAVTANAGSPFTKTCTQNTSGGTIGEAAQAGFSYSWSSSPAGFTSSAANPSVNPSVTTIYTVVKTNTTTGCFDSKSVTVTVDNAPVTANAGSPFTKTCTQNTSGGTIGEAAQAGFSYSWSSSPAGFTSSAANPSVNPSVTTIYTVVKTNTTTGCFDSKSVTVTVNNAPVTANAGSPFTKTCTQNTSGGTIGEAAQAGFSYSWSSSPAGFTSSAANPSVNPSVTTIYTVVKTNTASGCTDSKSVTVTVNTTPPDAPAICVSQPSLCGPATGSVSITSPLGADYRYSIDNGGTWQESPNFTGLAAGSVTGIKVKSESSGCVSSSVSCDASNCTPAPAVEKQVTPAPQQKTIVTKEPSKTVIEFTDDETAEIKAFPNPFSDKVKFVINSSVSGHGELMLYNQLGQKVKTVYSGRIVTGSQTIELSVPDKQNANYIYMLSIGGKRLTGKLMQINQ